MENGKCNCGVPLGGPAEADGALSSRGSAGGAGISAASPRVWMLSLPAGGGTDALRALALTSQPLASDTGLPPAPRSAVALNAVAELEA